MVNSFAGGPLPSFGSNPVLAPEVQTVLRADDGPFFPPDPYEDDQLGGLRLTKAGLRRRDRMVIEAVRAAGVPLVITLAGGYARHIEDTVAIHAATIEEALCAEGTLL